MSYKFSRIHFLLYIYILPLENQLPNSQVAKIIQCKSCAGISSEQVCVCVNVLYAVNNSTNKLHKNIYKRLAFKFEFQSDQVARHLC